MFGKNLRAARKKNGLTLEQVAEKYNQSFGGGLSKGTLSKYENDKQEPMVTVVFNLSKILKVNVDFLLNGEPATEEQCECWDKKYNPNGELCDEKNIPAHSVEGRNVIKIAGRDGTYEERTLTDEQLNALLAIINQMPDADDL